ncbi:fumarylacetoacetase [Nitzschia inconspicua]|uniref:fumarylacetoacetase n=1 Tax=Nitzschia inconspicua TaxID=303405 RepID=A0A9K3M5J6_9STRA|nr:fumarylacetoacetase [Nitzschia inconspicua]
MNFEAIGFLAASVPEDSDFSIDNIPFGIGTYTSITGRTYRFRCMTVIGNYAADLAILQDAGAFDDIRGLNENVFSQRTLNAFMDHSPKIWSQVRKRLQEIFIGTNALLQSNETLQKAVLHDVKKLEMSLPVEIGNYTDFYSSREHATNVGTMFRGKDNALNPNWLHLPVGYHGRASTVFCSGQDIVRPCGQLQKDPNDPTQGSVFGPCKLLDFELEVAFFVGNTKDDNYITGSPLTMEQAKQRIFGFVLMNDWSARDIQKWEYVPLGPFTSKNFATTISPWIVTYEALQAFQGPTSAVKQDNPLPLKYLQDPDYSSFDIRLSVSIQSNSMTSAYQVCESSFQNLYWNAAQQLVHHSVTGCLMRTGDLLGSGTISGTPEDSFGSMLELSWKGSKLVALSQDGTGESRFFLSDNDSVIMKGTCTKPNHGRVGFGECRGTVLAAGSKAQVRHLGGASLPQYESFKVYAKKSPIAWPMEIVLKAKKVPYRFEPASEEIPILEFKEVVSGKIHSVAGALGAARFLDDHFSSSKSLFPNDPIDEAYALEIVQIILTRMSLPEIINDSEKLKKALLEGLKNVRRMIMRLKDFGHGGQFVIGGYSPTIVECFLIPYLDYVKSVDVDLCVEFPELFLIDSLCHKHPWFQR